MVLPQQQLAQPMPQAPMSIAPQMPQAHTNPTQPMLAMIDKSATYEDYKRAGWTDEQLIQSGKAMMMPAANVAFPPAPQAVQAPPIPQAVAPVQAIPQAPIPAPMPTAAAMFQQAPVAPVQNMGIPQAPVPPAPLSAFEQPAPMNEVEPDDLPF